MKPVCPELEKSIYRLFEITPTPTVLSYPNGNLEYVNPALNELLGYADKEVFADDVIITHPDDFEVSQFVRASLSSAPFTPVKIKKRYLHKDGHTVYCLLTIVAQPNEDGSVRRYIAQLMDLSPVKKADATEILLNHLVELSSDAIYVIDPETAQILNCNSLGYRRLGYSKAELLNMTVGDVNHKMRDPELWKRHVEKMKQQSRMVIETEHSCKNGDKLAIETSISSTKVNNKVYFLAVARDITQRKARESEVLALVNQDPLTKLPNRRELENKLTEITTTASQEETLTAIIFLDLDNFKKINDNHGHSIGDAVLVGVADRLKKCVRESDLVVRHGGDEFLVVVTGFKVREQIEPMADKILEAFKSPFKIGTRILKVDASIGISVNTSCSLDTDTLIQCADEAMYVAKGKAGSARHYHQKD